MRLQIKGFCLDFFGNLFFSVMISLFALKFELVSFINGLQEVPSEESFDGKDHKGYAHLDSKIKNGRTVC